jgi:CheY-like chemotaxis protein
LPRDATVRPPVQRSGQDETLGLERQSVLLLIDDEPDSLEVMRVLLSTEGFHVLVATSGAEALLRIGEVRPDLIILDVMMPGMTGLDLCVYLRGTAETKNLPIVLLSATQMPPHSNARLYDRALLKPVELPVLMHAIRGLLPLKAPTHRVTS